MGLLEEHQPASRRPSSDCVIIKQCLDQNGCEVLTAADGGSALELAARSAPDLGVLAIVLRGMDGLTALEALRAKKRAPGHTRDRPLSSNIERRLVERSREWVDYLPKQTTDPATLSADCVYLASLSSCSAARVMAKGGSKR